MCATLRKAGKISAYSFKPTFVPSSTQEKEYMENPYGISRPTEFPEGICLQLGLRSCWVKDYKRKDSVMWSPEDCLHTCSRTTCQAQPQPPLWPPLMTWTAFYPANSTAFAIFLVTAVVVLRCIRMFYSCTRSRLRVPSGSWAARCPSRPPACLESVLCGGSCSHIAHTRWKEHHNSVTSPMLCERHCHHLSLFSSLPSHAALKSPAAFHEQRRSLERARVSIWNDLDLSAFSINLLC